MKLNIANPGTGLQKIVEIEDDKKLLPFFDRKMGAEIPGDSLGDEFKGYLFRISGGNDKQGFPMLQGVLVNQRVRLLFRKGMKCYRSRRKGEVKRKSVRGCIVGPDLAVMNLVVVKKGATDIPGLYDDPKPRRLGPKRANKIRALFNLSKKDDVRKFVVRRELEGKKKTKAPKIQRLISQGRLQRKRREKALKNRHVAAVRKDHAEYTKLMEEIHAAKKAKRSAEVAKKKKGAEPEKPAPKAEAKGKTAAPAGGKAKAAAAKPAAAKAAPAKADAKPKAKAAAKKK